MFASFVILLATIYLTLYLWFLFYIICEFLICYLCWCMMNYWLYVIMHHKQCRYDWLYTRNVPIHRRDSSYHTFWQKIVESWPLFFGWTQGHNTFFGGLNRARASWSRGNGDSQMLKLRWIGCIYLKVGCIRHWMLRLRGAN